MPRAKGGFKTRHRRNRIRKHAKGFRGGRSKLWKAAVEAVHRKWRYALFHRRKRKRRLGNPAAISDHDAPRIKKMLGVGK